MPDPAHTSACHSARPCSHLCLPHYLALLTPLPATVPGTAHNSACHSAWHCSDLCLPQCLALLTPLPATVPGTTHTCALALLTPLPATCSAKHCSHLIQSSKAADCGRQMPATVPGTYLVVSLLYSRVPKSFIQCAELMNAMNNPFHLKFKG